MKFNSNNKNIMNVMNFIKNKKLKIIMINKMRI